jgi:hypothetical protein
MRVLERLRQHAAGRDLERLAVPLEHVVRPGRDDDVDRLLPELPRAVRIDAESLELGAGRRAARPELDPPVGQQVEDRGRLGRAHRMVVRERHETHAVSQA